MDQKNRSATTRERKISAFIPLKKETETIENDENFQQKWFEN